MKPTLRCCPLHSTESMGNAFTGDDRFIALVAVVVDGSHECACQDLVKKSAPAEMAKTSGRSLFLISIPVRYLSIGGHLESAGKEGKKKDE